LIPISISAPQVFVMLLLIAIIFFIVLFLPSILELRKTKDAEPRKILESDGKEIIGFSVVLNVYFRENPREVRLLEDIEAPDVSILNRGFLSIPLPDIEF